MTQYFLQITYRLLHHQPSYFSAFYVARDIGKFPLYLGGIVIVVLGIQSCVPPLNLVHNILSQQAWRHLIKRWTLACTTALVIIRLVKCNLWDDMLIKKKQNYNSRVISSLRQYFFSLQSLWKPVQISFAILSSLASICVCCHFIWCLGVWSPPPCLVVRELSFWLCRVVGERCPLSPTPASYLDTLD